MKISSPDKMMLIKAVMLQAIKIQKDSLKDAKSTVIGISWPFSWPFSVSLLTQKARFCLNIDQPTAGRKKNNDFSSFNLTHSEHAHHTEI